WAAEMVGEPGCDEPGEGRHRQRRSRPDGEDPAPSVLRDVDLAALGVRGDLEGGARICEGGVHWILPGSGWWCTPTLRPGWGRRIVGGEGCACDLVRIAAPTRVGGRGARSG